MKKVLSLLLSFILLLAVFPVSTISAEALEDDVIEIRTIAELYNINSNMSGNYKLMNDIDMTDDVAVGGDWDFMGNGWEPIGSNGVYGSTAFTGTFDGSGHKIIGMRIVVNSIPSGTSTVCLGLFAKNEGTIKNLGIDSTSVVKNGYYCGGVCAFNSGTITNCYNEAGITSSCNSGGICARSSNGDFNNCYNTGIISSSGNLDVNCSGGICGYSYNCEINNCYNTGNIASTTNYHDDGYYYKPTYSVTRRCYSYAGGICGNNNSSINNCYNKGSIVANSTGIFTCSVQGYNLYGYSYAYCGGICGNSGDSNRVDIITYSYNNGEISAYSRATTKNSYYTGNTNSAAYSYRYAGGICGNQTDGIINNCYNTADISSSGTASASQTTISDANGGISGFLGVNGATISGCYNVGTATYGICGVVSGSITNCYYLSTAGSSNKGAKALTSAQLQLEMCMPEFDFKNTWLIDKVTDYKYPQLISNRQEEALNPESIEITLPDKTSYIIGEEFDPSGLVVTGHYENGISQRIRTFEISGFTGELGRNNITVTVGEKSTVFYVTVHDKGEWKTEKEPTCTNNGEKKLYCTDCGALLDTEEIPAKGHKEVVDKGHDATCTESGLTDGSHCSACDTILTEQEIIPAKGHIPYQNWETIKNPTCISHGEKVRHCSVCGEIVETAYIDVTDHQLVIDESKEATCLTSGLTEGSHCSVCNTVIVPQQVIQPKGHKWDNGEVTIQPSCSTSGEKVYHCKNCGQTKLETIPILGHDYSNEFTIDKEATCTEDGLKSKHCSRCDSTTEKTIIPKTNHRPSSEWIVVKEATTTEEGLEEKHCRDCGVVLDSRTIPLLPQLILGDVDGDGVVTIIDATCIQRHLAEIPIYSYNETAADTDGDGKVTILDATSIQRYLAELPCFAGIGSPISQLQNRF